MDSYAQSLEETQGIIAEFVNPKYKDSSKTAFKSSTRLECMMQDYPKALPSSAAVGFTVVNQASFGLALDATAVSAVMQGSSWSCVFELAMLITHTSQWLFWASIDPARLKPSVIYPDAKGC